MDFEQGPIRPPSEAKSLLIRITRNCPWNKCFFCITYKGKKFERRTVEQIKKDINNIRSVCDEVMELSWQMGEKGYITPKVIKRLREKNNSKYLQLAAWLHYGAKSVFLQDANSLVLKTEELIDILKYIKNKFPSVDRITTYARARTAHRKKIEELRQLYEHGLSRVHVGLESGSDNVLNLVNKGISSNDAIEGGKKLKQAGISTCFYVILGLGGKDYTNEHALETARAVNSVNPDYIRFRTLSVLSGTPLEEMVINNNFITLHEDEIVKEERYLIENIEGIDSYIVSDHALNLLEEVEGRLPLDKQRMLNVIDQYLQMSYEDKTNYRLGRRSGVYRYINDMNERHKYHYVSKGIENLKKEGDLERTIEYLRQRFL